MARKKVTSVPALADWGAVDNALRDIRECQHTLAEMAVQRDRQIDSIKADYSSFFSIHYLITDFTGNKFSPKI